ncbi:hypothetical protein [Vibrio jasicida]|uniref:hypothetical protein n=1 Tax=Vibrio jasicida TaxID=766224 RepID=UPI0005EE2D1F|nr:hypothetical protein [Vibrio jasicida]
MCLLFLDSFNCISRLLDVELLLKDHSVHFDGIYNYGESNAFYKNYDAVVFTNFQNPIAHKIILQCKLLGVKTIFLTDGIFDWANAFSNPKHEAVNLYSLFPIDFDQLIVAGNTQSTNYFKYLYKNLSVKTYLPLRNKNLYIKDTDMSERVLITTANTAYFSELELERLIKLIDKTTESLIEINIRFDFRIFDSNLLQRLKHKNYGKNIISGDFHTASRKYCAYFTTPSSVILDLALLNRPIFTYLYRDTPLQVHSGWLIFEGLEIKELLSSVILSDKNSPDYDYRLAYQRSLVETNTTEKDIFMIEKSRREKNIIIGGFTTKNYIVYLISKFIFVLSKRFK